jgi:hypothetical protein
MKTIKETIEKYWGNFLKEYWFQKCSCGGHSSFWRTVILSPEWKAWKKHNKNMNWDFDECEELGIMSQEHWEEFIKFIKYAIKNKRRRS